MGEHPDLVATGARLREEWRAEQEAATRDAVEHWQHGRSLRDRLVEHMHRGDRIAVTVAGFRVAGVPDEVGDDLLGVRTLFGRVDVHLTPSVPLSWEMFEAAAVPGHRGVDAAGGRFVQALRRHEGEPGASVGTVMDPGGIDGRLVVAADHLVIVANVGAQTTVPLAFVSWVSARRS